MILTNKQIVSIGYGQYTCCREIIALRTQVAELEREAKVSKGCIRGLSHENEALKDNLVRDGRMQEDARAMIRDLEAQLRTAREDMVEQIIKDGEASDG